AQIHFDTQPAFPQLTCNLFGVLIDAVGNRQHRDLNRREPQRKSARVMLDQHAKEALDRTKQRAVNHHRAMRLVVLADEFKFETLGQIEIPLDRAELPQTTDGIFNLKVDLRPVESSLSFHALILDSARIQSIRQGCLSLFPIFCGAEPLLVRVAALDGKLKLYLVEAKRLQ